MISALGLVGNNCFKVIEFHPINRTNFVRVMINMSVEHNLNSYVVSDILAAFHISLHCLRALHIITDHLYCKASDTDTLLKCLV